MKHPTFTHAYDLEEICRPLQTLGITYFCHAVVDEKSNMSGIGLCPEYVKTYFEKNLYHADIHRICGSSSQEFVLRDLLESDQDVKALYEHFRSFGLGHAFTISKKNETGTDFYYFATKLNNAHINEKYLQNIDLLLLFTNYFRDKVYRSKELRAAYDIKFKLHDSQNSKQTVASDLFYQHTGCDRIYIKDEVYLTKREWECLYLLANGKTLEQVAAALCITLRTVKAHVQNMKMKLSCDNLFQLGVVYQQLSSYPKPSSSLE